MSDHETKNTAATEIDSASNGSPNHTSHEHNGTTRDPEKALHPVETRGHRVARLHEYREDEGYIIDADSDGNGYKVAKDGRTRLIPQPSDDPRDPLNWSWGKKHLVLICVACAALLPDYGSATGAVTLIPQAAEWGMTPDEVNHSQAGNVIMLGLAGPFIVFLASYLGRLPTVFYFLIVATATAAWCAGAKTFDSFFAARILNGFFSTVCQVCGLIFVQDMFFFHERARKINIWASFFIISPYLGPLLAAFMLTTQDWPIPFWVYFAETATCLILTILFVQETYYDRSLPAAEQPQQGSRIGRLTGASQWKSRHLRNTFAQSAWRPFSVLLKPTVFLTAFYYCLTFAWVVGINTTLSIFVTPLYGFGPKQIGFFYFTPIVAVILGEITGHWLHDVIAKQYIRTHNGHFEPEVRLRAVFIALPFMVVGLVVIGQSLENDWHYMATSISWGLYVFGIMITTVALSSYSLDSYPEASGEVSCWLNLGRVLGGFIISYFQVTWATAEGPATSFGAQAAICGGAIIIVIFLVLFGKRMRVWAGPLNFTTA